MPPMRTKVRAGAQAIPASEIETLATETDLLVVSDASKTNEEKAISIRDLIASAGLIRNVRKRLTIAAINAGNAEVLPAVPGYTWRHVASKAIAVGGAVGAVTTVDLMGVVSTARKLVAFAQANLTQSAVVKDGATGGTVLANGASYIANDANTAITVSKTGDDITTATHVDIIADFVLEKA